MTVVNYILFRNVAAVAVVSLGVALFLFFPALYVQLVPGLAFLWGEIAVGFAANRAAHVLTKRGIALKGIEGEQNPTAKKMFATGNFTKLYLTYGLVFAAGVVLTALSVYVGAVWLGTLVIMLFFPMVLVYDMLNDYYWVKRYEREVAPRSGGLVPSSSTSSKCCTPRGTGKRVRTSNLSWLSKSGRVASRAERLS